MTTQRKVRKDFDMTAEYSVDVSACTEEEKKEVQQAFFDVGIPWKFGGEEYQHYKAMQYTNKHRDGEIAAHLLAFESTKGCNMTAKEFLDLVYEPEQQGHVHAELMAQYAEDAKTHAEPWELWQVNYSVNFKEGKWLKLRCNPSWSTDVKYRRKPKTKLIHGVEVPDISFTPNDGEEYVYPNIYGEDYANASRFYSGYEASEMALKAGCCYPYTEEGTQAAILHAKIMLGIDPGTGEEE